MRPAQVQVLRCREDYAAWYRFALGWLEGASVATRVLLLAS